YHKDGFILYIIACARWSLTFGENGRFTRDEKTDNSLYFYAGGGRVPVVLSEAAGLSGNA
ncbi:hypothetical protein T265_16090, partial [Opisthorchis viverrini]